MHMPRRAAPVSAPKSIALSRPCELHRFSIFISSRAYCSFPKVKQALLERYLPKFQASWSPKRYTEITAKMDVTKTRMMSAAVTGTSAAGNVPSLAKTAYLRLPRAALQAMSADLCALREVGSTALHILGTHLFESP